MEPMSGPRPGPRPARGLSLRGRSGGLLRGLRGVLFTGLLLALLAAVEIAARFARSDAEEAFGFLALLLFGMLVRRRHRRDPLPWVDALLRARRRLGGAFRRQASAVGIDLRRTPPVAAAFPPLLGAAVAVLAAVPVLLLLFPAFDAAAAREGIRSVLATGWLLVLGAAWALFAGGGFYLLFLTLALTHDELVRSHTGPGPRPRHRETLAFAFWPAAVLAGWTFLPASAPLAVLAACLAAAVLALALPGGPDVALLWKRKEGSGALRSVPWRTHTLAGTAAVGLLVADSLLLVKGDALRGGGEERLLGALPVTAALVSLFAWTGAAALLAWSHLVVRTALLARFRDPARPLLPTVLVADLLPRAERSRVAEALGRSGLRARFGPSRPRPGEVVATLSGEPTAQEAGRIRRRWENGCRRLLLRGLEKLFKKAAARRFQQGNGFWVAPWHWFCVGLSRDEDERAMDWKEGTFFLETVGPSYHRVFPRAVLHHAHEVMRGLQVDLVFVEDGVGFRRLRRVLRMAFELHDIFGGRGRAEEHHFTGLPGVRVLLHEFDMAEPLLARREGYPEPDYESVGRARILHVFRDRGECEETSDAPRDRRGVPVPA